MPIFFHDQTICITDCENPTIGYSLVVQKCRKFGEWGVEKGDWIDRWTSEDVLCEAAWRPPLQQPPRPLKPLATTWRRLLFFSFFSFATLFFILQVYESCCIMYRRNHCNATHGGQKWRTLWNIAPSHYYLAGAIIKDIPKKFEISDQLLPLLKSY